VESSQAKGDRIGELEEENARLRALVEKDSRRSSQRAPKIPQIADKQRTPLVLALLEVIQYQQEQMGILKEEIARLKGQNPRPKIKPSRLEKSGRKGEKKAKGKRPGSAKRSKTAELKIHDVKRIRPENLPAGSRFKGYQDYTVQNLTIGAHNTLYRLERWKTPAGENRVGKLPQQAGDGHFGLSLVRYILYQYYHAQVTQPLIVEQLRELGIDISTGQVNRIISEVKPGFHAEKDELLRVGLEVSNYLQVDDTGARHDGQNGYCTHIGNELFAWFESRSSKSRINFLELLRAGHEDYVINAEALAYMRAHRLPRDQLTQLEELPHRSFPDQQQWHLILEQLELTAPRHVRIATEGALLGSVVEHGPNPNLVILSDDAGQFDVLRHALCWIHAERTISKLIGLGPEQRRALEQTRVSIWDFYTALKAYKQSPSREQKAALEQRFEEIFATETCFVTLNKALQRLYRNKSELLQVLQRPDLPLHNNLSERDLREYVKKRKISGSTRSDEGRRCRDTFTSLKKTCRKLGISFWEYLADRICGQARIPPLSQLIRRRAEQLWA
jgi:hypothetical protein